MTALSGPDRDQLRQQLAEEVRRMHHIVHCGCGCGWCTYGADRLLDRLLPVVEAHTRAARADELERLSTHVKPASGVLGHLTDRIASLRTNEGDIS